MTDALPEDVIAQIARVGPCEIAIGVPTYNNAGTAAGVAEAVRVGVEKHFRGVSLALVNADVGSSDGTPQVLAQAGVPSVLAHSEASLQERAEVPFHGVPGRGNALRTILEIAHRLTARVLVLLEADVTTITDEWPQRLARPIREDGADWVAAAHLRHRYDGTITRLLLSPLLRALYGRTGFIYDEKNPRTNYRNTPLAGRDSPLYGRIGPAHRASARASALELDGA